MFDVTVVPASDPDQEIDYHEIDYISLINSETFGKPPLISPNDDGRRVANRDATVLYLNSAHFLAVFVEVK